MRLIDADALMAKMLSTSRYFYIKYDIDDAPTVDAIPVVHGWWNNQSFSLNGGRVLLFTCSECNHEQGGESNYCPNCGARMDGDGNG